MISLDYAQLQVGQRVAVARSGSWNISNQGFYTVKSANKVRVVIVREGDGYERTFLVKSRKEAGKSESHYERSFIESVEAQQKRLDEQVKRAYINGLWRDLDKAVSNKQLDSAKSLILQIETAQQNG